MKTAFDNYIRLAKSILGMSSLWLGQDHLVYVRGSGFIQSFSEEYLRYRFRDIQAFTVTKTSRIGVAMLYLLGILFFAGITALILTVRKNEPMGTAMLVFLSALALPTLILILLLLRHYILGPTCHCVIQTSLKKDRIRPLNRLHAATQCIEIISKKVNKSQKSLAVSINGTGSSEQTKPASRTAESELRVPFLVVPTFATLAFFGVAVLSALHLESPVLTGISIVLLVLGSVCLQITLIQCIRFATPEPIKTSMWILLGFVFLNYGAGIVYFVYAATIDPVFTLSIFGPIEALAGAASVGGMGFYLCFLLLSLGTLVVSLLGVIKSLKWRARIELTNAKVAEPTQSEEP